MLEKEEKEEIIKKYQLQDVDTGSFEVQIALLTEKIRKLVLHLKENKKDLASKRGLLKMVARRRKLLRKLKEEDEKRYESLVKKLGIKQ
jgi:small subunit ribosomal protein S15